MTHDMAHDMAHPWRQLATDQEEFEQASLVAQIFSGAMFTALVVYLVFSNSTRLSYIQKASLEKRLGICCQINTIVAALSAFLNYFQLTEVDNWALPGQRSMVIDMARPVEWILTCPLMQLSLVIMGGSRIPEYRRTMMPALATLALALATTTLFVDFPWVFVIFGVGLCVHSTAMFFNRQQIIEHSRGVEGLLEGDSEFRKATLILMLTWFPFPVWYILSPEGLNIITSIAVVQMGWAFLNIISKFSLIFYIQRVKDNYCNRLKVKREMKGMAAMANAQTSGDDDEGSSVMGVVDGELSACVIETMGDLGMAYNIDRLLILLRNAEVFTLADIEKFSSQEECDRMQLPFDLVSAIQRKHKIWALEMVDDAERGLDKGEKHYGLSVTNTLSTKKARSGAGLFLSPSNVVPCEAISLQPNQPMKEFSSDHSISQHALPLAITGMVSPMSNQICGYNALDAKTVSFPAEGDEFAKQHLKPLETRMEHFEERVMGKFDHVMQSLAEQMQKQLEQTQRSQHLLDAKLESVVALQQKESAAMSDTLSDKMEGTVQRIEAGSQDRSVTSARALEQSLHVTTKKIEEHQESNKEALSQLGVRLSQMMDGWAQHTMQESKAVAFTLQTKMAQLEESQDKKTANMEESIMSRLQKVITDSTRNIGVTTAEQTQSSCQQLQCSIESVKKSGVDHSSKLELKLMQFVKELNQDLSKNVEMGLGVVGNSLRAQLEGMQASAVMNHTKTEANICYKFQTSLDDSQQRLLEALLQQSHHLAAELQVQTQGQTREQIAKSTDRITGLLESTNREIRSQRLDTEEISSAMRNVTGGTDEVVGTLAKLCDQVGLPDDCGMSPEYARPLSSTGGRGPMSPGGDYRGDGRRVHSAARSRGGVDLGSISRSSSINRSSSRMGF